MNRAGTAPVRAIVLTRFATLHMPPEGVQHSADRLAWIPNEPHAYYTRSSLLV
jgi:hypothetical protein